MEESSEAEDDGREIGHDDEDGRGMDDRGLGRGHGIRSSWRGDRSRTKRESDVPMRDSAQRQNEESSDGSSKGKGRMVDVGLDSMIEEDAELLEVSNQHDKSSKAKRSSSIHQTI